MVETLVHHQRFVDRLSEPENRTRPGGDVSRSVLPRADRTSAYRFGEETIDL